MMKLILKTPYLSIQKWDDLEIADFSVVTGVNGSGKSHLLKAIEIGSIEIENIDQSEIILYGYDDFTVNNTNTTQITNEKFINFQNKSNSLSQKLNDRRFQTINKLTIPVPGNDHLNINYITDINYLAQSTNWSSEQLNYYLSALPDNYHTYQPPFDFFHKIGLSIPKVNTQEFLVNINLIGSAIILLRNFGYSEESLKWSYGEYESFKAQNLSIYRPDPATHETLHRRFTDSFISFMYQYEELLQQNPTLKATPFLDFYNIVEKTLKNIEISYKQNLEPSLLKQIEIINKGKSILAPIQSDHGFFNIYEIEQAEKQYQILHKQNKYNRFLHAEDESIYFLTEEDFAKANGESPVLILNKVLEEYDCNGYEFKQTELPDQLGVDFNNLNISISLFNKKDGFYTSLDALSSGERTLLALAFSIYKLRRNKIIAKLFLMDEVDSALHPYMSKRLISVLHDYFHKELGINIIISTHSPSSVAFAPDDSLLVMKKDPVPQLLRVTKDGALKELTEGVPSFSINYENRRQVFVEDRNDAQYYEKLYTIFASELEADVSLNFISVSDAKKNKKGGSISGCQAVIDVTSLLRDKGNKFVYGLVDGDNLRQSDDCIKVLGNGNRYSIENYLLDPILLSIIIFIEKEKDSDTDMINIRPGDKYINIINYTEEELQTITDSIFTHIGPKFSDTTIEQIDSRLVNGKKIRIPKSFLEHEGHSLEDLIKEAFPQLKRFSKEEETLMVSILNKVVAIFPSLAPMDLVSTLKELQK